MTEAIQKVDAAYNCKIVEGVLSHQLKLFVIDGNKVILSVASPEMRVDDAEFEENEVYAVDIVITTGEGKANSEGKADSKCALVYGQMNEPPAAHAHVYLAGLTVSEHFRDAEVQDVLLSIDKIFRFTQANSEFLLCLDVQSAVTPRLTQRESQMNEPPAAHAHVYLAGLTVSEHFCDAEVQDVLLSIDKIFRFTQANSEFLLCLDLFPLLLDTSQPWLLILEVFRSVLQPPRRVPSLLCKLGIYSAMILIYWYQGGL